MPQPFSHTKVGYIGLAYQMLFTVTRALHFLYNGGNEKRQIMLQNTRLSSEGTKICSMFTIKDSHECPLE